MQNAVSGARFAPAPLTAGTAPTHPKPDDGTPASWTTLPLARTSHSTSGVGKIFETVAFAGRLNVNAAQQFMHIASAGASFGDAVAAAQQLSKMVAASTGRRGAPLASPTPTVALLQARDGAYWGAVLSTSPLGTDTRSFPLSIRPLLGRVVRAEAMIPSTKAIVSNETYIDMRPDPRAA